MEPINFCYWMQGFFELANHNSNSGLSPEQAREIKNHLALVLQKVTPQNERKSDTKISVLPPINFLGSSDIIGPANSISYCSSLEGNRQIPQMLSC